MVVVCVSEPVTTEHAVVLFVIYSCGIHDQLGGLEFLQQNVLRLEILTERCNSTVILYKSTIIRFSIQEWMT